MVERLFFSIFFLNLVVTVASASCLLSIAILGNSYLIKCTQYMVSIFKILKSTVIY